MISTTTTIPCGRCGAVDLGTRFCETCGAALRAAPDTVSQVSSVPADPRTFTIALRVYLAAYLAGDFVGLAGEFGSGSLYGGGNSGWIVLNAVSVILALAVEGGLLLAAFASPVSLGRKLVGLTIVLIQPLFLSLALIVNFTGWYDLYEWLSFLTVGIALGPILLVLAWLLVTGLPPRAYIALTIVIPTTFVSFLLFRSIGLSGVAGVMLEAAGVITALIVARRLARGPSDRIPVPNSEGYVPLPGATPGTNTLAILALIFGVLGGSILPIIFGHIARSQIRRTGESGWGFALAGLILGYLSTSVVLILILAAIAAAARSGTYL